MIKFRVPREFNVIPISKSSKKPMVKWEDYQTKRFPRKKLTSYSGINYAVICGRISNNLMVVDLDYKGDNKHYFLQIYNKFQEQFPEISKTFVVETPHGHHFYYYLDKPHKRNIRQNTKKDTIIKLLKNGKNPTLSRVTNFPNVLKGTDFIGAGYAIIPPSKYMDLSYKPINENSIIEITTKSLEKVKNFFLRDIPEKSRMRNPFFEIITGKIDLKELANSTGLDEHVYWKYTYLEAYHNLDLEPEDVIPFLEKNQPHFNIKTTVEQLPHIDLESKPMLNKTVKEYFPSFKERKTEKKIQITPLYVSIAEDLKKKYEFITMEDTDQIYIKKGNIYSPKLGKFKNDLAKAIAETGKTITHLSSNVLKYIRYTTQFDRKDFCYDNWLINFRNGYYDLKTDKFYPNNKYDDKLFCYEIPHDFKEGEYDCPEFKKLLEQWLDNNGTIRPSDMFEMMGYTMTMNTDMKTAFFIYGETHTGKTQFQTILEHVVGHQNRGAVPLQRLSKNEFGSDGLEFKILNMVGDMSSIAPNDTSTFKWLTGGDIWVGAEYKGGKKYEFRNVIKIWYNGNMIPILINDDDTFYGRWILIPFLNQFPMYDKKTIKNIGKKLCEDEDEVQGIIHEAINGLRRLMNRNYFRYEVIKNTKHAWRYEAEPLYAFINDNCSYDEDDGIQCNEFKRKFNKFLYTRKLRPESSQTLKDKLEKFGIYKERHGSGENRDYYFMGFKWKGEPIDKEWERKYFS